MNSHLPDLGALGQPQQLQIVPSALIREATGLPPLLVDGVGLVEMMRAMVREEVMSALVHAGLFTGKPEATP